jgi:hypothetical protein
MIRDTPYLLRIEMLKIAQNRASEIYQAHFERARIKSQIYQKTNYLDNLDYPTVEQIIEEARKMKDFIDGK